MLTICNAVDDIFDEQSMIFTSINGRHDIVKYT